MGNRSSHLLGTSVGDQNFQRRTKDEIHLYLAVSTKCHADRKKVESFYRFFAIAS